MAKSVTITSAAGSARASQSAPAGMDIEAAMIAAQNDYLDEINAAVEAWNGTGERPVVDHSEMLRRKLAARAAAKAAARAQ